MENMEEYQLEEFQSLLKDRKWVRSNGLTVDIESMNKFHLAGALNKCLKSDILKPYIPILKARLQELNIELEVEKYKVKA